MTEENENAVVKYEQQNLPVAAPLSVNEILGQVHLIQEVMGKVMQDGEHYGTIPGCGDKKTLLQPGAQKLTMTFRLAPSYEIQETNLAGGHKEYRVVCSLRSIQSQTLVGQGVGVCSTMETKYRFKGGSRKCPECGKETIIKGKAEYGGGWLCFAKKGGCGAKWPDGAAIIENQRTERVEHDNPADHFNTVLKMAKKRAFVDATITATAASDIFTQDVFDPEEDTPKEPEKPNAAPAKSAAPAKPKTTTPPVKPNGKTFLEACKARLLEVAYANNKALAWAWWRVAVNAGCLDQLRNLDEAKPEELFPIDPKLPKDDQIKQAKDQMERFQNAVQALVDNCSVDQAKEIDKQYAAACYQPPPNKSARVAEPASEPDPAPLDDEWWRDFVIPIPHKGEKREDYMKNPETIGQLYDARHDDDEARKRLWGFLNHYEPKGWVKKDGTKMPPSENDLKFREALDAFGEYLEENGEEL